MEFDSKINLSDKRLNYSLKNQRIMKIYKTGIVILSALVYLSCGTNKQKEKEYIDEAYTMINISKMTPIEESNTLSEDISANKMCFVPPTICSDNEMQESKMQISLTDIDYDQLKDEEYSQFTENKFQLAKKEPLSTFSIDVDNHFLRKMLFV